MLKSERAAVEGIGICVDRHRAENGQRVVRRSSTDEVDVVDDNTRVCHRARDAN